MIQINGRKRNSTMRTVLAAAGFTLVAGLIPTEAGAQQSRSRDGRASVTRSQSRDSGQQARVHRGATRHRSRGHHAGRGHRRGRSHRVGFHLGYRGYYGSPWHYGGGTRTTVHQYTEANVYIDMVDSSEHKMVWQGVATFTVTDKMQEQLRETVYNTVNEIFAKFPIPGPASSG